VTPNPSTYGASVTFQGKVTDSNNKKISGATPVNIYADGILIANDSSNNGGVYSASYSGLTAGSHPVYAVYMGDLPDHAPVTSSTIILVVNKATATVTLGNLTQTYNGSPRSATATTVPAGLTVNITYNGSATATITITQDGTTKTCTLPLPHGMPVCQ